LRQLLFMYLMRTGPILYVAKKWMYMP